MWFAVQNCCAFPFTSFLHFRKEFVCADDNSTVVKKIYEMAMKNNNNKGREDRAIIINNSKLCAN